MAQQILKPDDQTTAGEWKPDRRIGKRIREEFGRFPNFDEWRPGDLLLFHDPRWFSFVSRLIVWAQRDGYGSNHARWHHAAVYVGDGFVCEASMIGGVRRLPLHAYVGKHWIRVRRDSRLSELDGYKIAIRAMTRLGQSYDFGAILLLIGQLIGGLWKRPTLALNFKGAICSRLYELAYWAAAGRTLHDTDGRPIIPAELSRTDRLVDVAVHWRRITHG
ncbi:MAG: hypothetical protein AAB223_10520 [Pseudomonadota bacterium]